MDATRRRSVMFFIQFLVLLGVAVVWVQIDFVRRRVGEHLTLFYLLIGGAACLLVVRAYMAFRGRITERWRTLWLASDLAIITAAVYLTGGINSEAALLYFWPIASSSIQRLPRRTVFVSVATALLYLLATWADRGNEKYLGALVARFAILFAVTSLAVYYARTETVRIEELAKLRERVALADYRQRLSREMHDGIQHYLADIVMRLELARRLMTQDPLKAARLAVDQRFAVRRAAAELRYLVRLLRSPAVEREGFVDALRHHLSVFSEDSSVSAPLEIEGEITALPAEIAHAAFRIIQEALMNAEKHAQATQVKVALRFAPAEFACTVKDDGIGFDAAAIPAAGIDGGLGLPGMAQRAQAVGGFARVTSAPGQGTEIAFTVPLSNLPGQLPRES
jgi:signal transduction histidine kinase